MTTEELQNAVNVLVRRLTARLEVGDITPPGEVYMHGYEALRSIEDAIVHLVAAHARIQKASQR